MIVISPLSFVQESFVQESFVLGHLSFVIIYLYK